MAGMPSLSGNMAFFSLDFKDLACAIVIMIPGVIYGLYNSP